VADGSGAGRNRSDQKLEHGGLTGDGDDAGQRRVGSGPVPWAQTLLMLTAISIPIALNRWSLNGFQAAARFLGVMATTGVGAALCGRRSRAALILYSLAVVVGSITIYAVLLP